LCHIFSTCLVVGQFMHTIKSANVSSQKQILIMVLRLHHTRHTAWRQFLRFIFCLWSLSSSVSLNIYFFQSFSVYNVTQVRGFEDGSYSYPYWAKVMAILLSFDSFWLIPIYAVYQIAQVLKGRKRWIEVCCNRSYSMRRKILFAITCFFQWLCQISILDVSANPIRILVIRDQWSSVCTCGKVLWVVSGEAFSALFGQTSELRILQNTPSMLFLHWKDWFWAQRCAKTLLCR